MSTIDITAERAKLEAYIDAHLLNGKGPQANDVLIKVSVNGTVVTKSDTKGYLDTIPLSYTDLELFADGPDLNTSAGLVGGDKITIPDAGFIIPGNATIGALPASMTKGATLDIEYIKLQEANGIKTASYGYELKKARLLGSVKYYPRNEFATFIIRVQNLEFKINTFDEKGVKLGVGSAMAFDSATGESK